MKHIGNGWVEGTADELLDSGSAGRRLAKLRWSGHAKAAWKPIKIRETTLADLRSVASEMGGETIDATISNLIEFRRNILKTSCKKHTQKQTR